MSEATKMQPNQVLIVGKVVEVTTDGDRGYRTAVCQPAPDEFSNPGFVMIYSEKRLAQKGDMLQQMCNAAGYRQRVDGQQGPWTKYTNTLRAVE